MTITKQYHAFTDEQDDWFDTLEEATACIDAWRAEGYENLRIYVEEHDGEEMIDEDGIFFEGDFPW